MLIMKGSSPKIILYFFLIALMFSCDNNVIEEYNVSIKKKRLAFRYGCNF